MAKRKTAEKSAWKHHEFAKRCVTDTKLALRGLDLLRFYFSCGGTTQTERRARAMTTRELAHEIVVPMHAVHAALIEGREAGLVALVNGKWCWIGKE